MSCATTTNNSEAHLDMLQQPKMWHSEGQALRHWPYRSIAHYRSSINLIFEISIVNKLSIRRGFAVRPDQDSLDQVRSEGKACGLGAVIRAQTAVQFGEHATSGHLRSVSVQRRWWLSGIGDAAQGAREDKQNKFKRNWQWMMMAVAHERAKSNRIIFRTSN